MSFQQGYTPAGHCLQREKVLETGPVRAFFFFYSHSPVKLQGHKASSLLQWLPGYKPHKQQLCPKDASLCRRTAGADRPRLTSSGQRAEAEPSCLMRFPGPQSLRSLRVTAIPCPCLRQSRALPALGRPRRALAPSAGAPRGPAGETARELFVKQIYLSLIRASSCHTPTSCTDKQPVFRKWIDKCDLVHVFL